MDKEKEVKNEQLSVDELIVLKDVSEFLINAGNELTLIKTRTALDDYSRENLIKMKILEERYGDAMQILQPK